MPGNNQQRVVITERDGLLLKELGVARIVDREQAKEIAGFQSTTRANDRLLKLTNSGLLKRFFLGTRAGGTKALYSLSRKGAAVVDVPGRLVRRRQDSLLVGDQFVEHQLSINSIWIQAKFRPIPSFDIQFVRWLTFQSPLSLKTPLIPDGYFELKSPSGTHAMFLEVDRGSESLKVWTRKVSLYLQLAASGEFQELFKTPRFRVLVAVSSERRLETIRRTVRQQTEKIFWFSTLDTINRDGLFAPIWLRPEGAERQSLL